ncbi:uncharacterized protein G2W53_044849 [Senna tora]|uniref:Uncharacterized protein n=1 Tax=Senna tora TaxID=362788 RepID=A0A834SCA5_9FABA|nr:uncharacterized protein G2W53_044849 [Senna tora]
MDHDLTAVKLCLDCGLGAKLSFFPHLLIGGQILSFHTPFLAFLGRETLKFLTEKLRVIKSGGPGSFGAIRSAISVRGKFGAKRKALEERGRKLDAKKGELALREEVVKLKREVVEAHYIREMREL